MCECSLAQRSQPLHLAMKSFELLIAYYQYHTTVCCRPQQSYTANTCNERGADHPRRDVIDMSVTYRLEACRFPGPREIRRYSGQLLRL